MRIEHVQGGEQLVKIVSYKPSLGPRPSLHLQKKRNVRKRVWFIDAE